MTREIFDHKGTSPASSELSIVADGDVGKGGECSRYIITLQPENPASTPYVTIHFQNGPIKEAGVNGVTEQALIAIVIDRLRSFQSGPFACRENALALTKLEEGMHWLAERTRDRERRGVEGTYKK